MSGSLRCLACALLAATMLSACSQPRPREEGPSPAPAHPEYDAIVARGQVEVPGGLLVLRSAVPGVVQKVQAREGEHVDAGAPLLQLDDGAARDAVRSAAAELAQAAARLALAERSAPVAAERARRLAEAAATGAGEGQLADDAGLAAAEAEAGIAIARAQRDAARLRVDAARRDLDHHVMRAPQAAQVLRVLVGPGSQVAPSPGGALMTLLPDGQREVRAEFAVSDLPRLGVGGAAVITGDEGAGGCWTGRLLHVDSVVGATSLEDDPRRAVNRSVAAMLSIDRGAAPPLVGQRVLVRLGAAGKGATGKTGENHACETPAPGR